MIKPAKNDKVDRLLWNKRQVFIDKAPNGSTVIIFDTKTHWQIIELKPDGKAYERELISKTWADLRKTIGYAISTAKGWTK